MKTTTITLPFCLLCSILFASQPQTSWTVSMEPQKVFIENKSQFDNCLPIKKQAALNSFNKILFATEKSGTQILFTKSGVTYLFEKRNYKKINESLEKDHPKNHEELEKEEHEMDIETGTVKMQWEGANADVEVTGQLPATNYYSYSPGGRGTLHARAYQKILYKNLYPNIDVEYIFHTVQGIEYSFILHPGADPSQIKMKWTGSSKIHLDQANNLRLSTRFGDIVDHAPKTIYAGSNNAEIKSFFRNEGKTISFVLENYDVSKEVIIDPWTVTPALPNSNKIFCIKPDSSNNVYVYGGDSPFKLKKYNASGVLQWTYSSPWDSAHCWFGTLEVDRAGNSYITSGSIAAIAKINSGGNLQWITNSSAQSTDEYWDLAFNQDETQLIAGGTILQFSPTATGSGVLFNINLANGAQVDTVTVASLVHEFIACPNEVRSVCFSPDGNYYFLTLDTFGSITPSFGINYRLATGQQFGYRSPSYGFTPQGHNAICANGNFVYTTNGAFIQKRSVNTGNVIAFDSIPNGSFTTQPNTPVTIYPDNGGIAIDNCGNIYVGSKTQLHKYDANLNLLASSNTPGPVYAVAVNNNGEVLAAGNGFATSVNMSACSPYLPMSFHISTSQTNSSCGSLCTGILTATPSNGSPPYTYLWSANNQNTQTITGLCPGNYSVTVTDSSGITAVAYATINSSTINVTHSVTSTVCGGNTGEVVVTPISGIAPYTYLWSTGDSTPVISNLPAGTYSVLVADSAGCSRTDTAVVYGTGTGTISITTDKTSFCPFDTAHICAPGGYSSYLWNNGETTACIAGTNSGSYHVTVTDNSNCSLVSNSVTLTVITPPIVTVSLAGDSLYAFSSNPQVDYAWYQNGTYIPGSNAPYYVPTQSGTYYADVADSHGCGSESNWIYFATCSAHFTLSPDTITPHNWWALNQATGNPPLSYLWNWDDGNTSTGAFPQHIYAAPGNYNICVTVSDATACTVTFCDSSTYIYKAEGIATVNVVGALPNGITESGMSERIFISPNPAGNELNIYTAGSLVLGVHIYNTSGQLLADVNQPRANRIDISQLSPGVYIAEINTRELKYRLRWIKM